MTQDNQPPGWSESNSQLFIEYGRYFIPEREWLIEAMCDLIPPVAGSQHLLDLCCGEGALTGALLERFPDYVVHALDGSPLMVEQVRTTLAAYGDRLQTGIFELESRAWRQFPWPVHGVVSSLSIHHLDAEEKQQLFRDVRQFLAPGGVFLIADIMQPITQAAIDLAAKAWDAEVLQRSKQLGGDLKAYNYFQETGWNSFRLTEPDPIDKMSPLFDQLKWLEQAGFVDVDVFWMNAGHALFGGRVLA